MSFIAILFALLLEQARPLAPGNWVHAAMRGWLRWVLRHVDAGREPHGWLAWTLAVGGPAAVVLLIHWVLMAWAGWLVAVLWSIGVLYVTLGFRHFSHHFTDIRDALEAGDDETARRLLAEWRQVELRELPRSELVRQVIEHSVLSAHRHVFGVLSWFSLLAALGLGPAGAVIYRMAEFSPRYWPHLASTGRQPVSDAAREAAGTAWVWVDWLPARMTALGFAVVGSFEDAIDSWRQHALRQPADNDGVILAATSGALNLRLRQVGEDEGMAASDRQEPELAHLRSIVGLLWRTVVLWMLLLALLTFARLLG